MPYQLLLDTSSLMYRAFFALPQSITDSEGQPINAVRGYLDMAANLLRTYAPDELIHVYDHDWRPAGRAAVYPPYKADRPDDPETLPPQFDVLRRVLTALGETQAEAPDWEADDAIGTLCAKADAGDRLDIVTGDRDLLQLVRNGNNHDGVVRVLYTRRGVTELDVFDRDAVAKKYGVPPEQYAEFATLRGDPSDGLPGVPGIGEKTAARLMRKYGSIAALLDDADAQTPKLSQNLNQAREYLTAMEQVVPIRTDVEIRTVRPQPDAEALEALVERYDLSSPVARLQEARDGSNADGNAGA